MSFFENTSSNSVVGVLKGPLLGLLESTFLILLPVVSDLLVKGIIEVGSGHKCLDRKKDSSDLESRRPLGLKDVETDAAELVDVGVVDLSSEKNLRWHHGVIVWQKELTVEDSALIRCLSGTSDLNVEMSEVLLGWLSIDANDRILCKSLRFLSSYKFGEIQVILTLRILGGIAIKIEYK